MEYVIATRDLRAQDVFSIRDRLAPTGIPTFLQEAFGELYGRLGLLGVPPAGHPFVIYHAFGPTEMDAEVCVPIAQPASATGRIVSRQLPALTVARTLHVGPYEELGAAYRALTDWVERNGFETSGPVQGRYLNGPGEGVGPADFRTEMEIPVIPAAVAVPA